MSAIGVEGLAGVVEEALFFGVDFEGLVNDGELA